MPDIRYPVLSNAQKLLKDMNDGTHADEFVDATGLAGSVVVTSALPFTGTATNLLVLEDITITAITAPGMTNASALVGRVLATGTSLPHATITALTISSGVAVMYA